ncbi:MAG: cytochrome c [Sphingobacteriales bacterium]|nr:MAG: cytochrome c [Sphingobacteriales bacterium]
MKKLTLPIALFGILFWASCGSSEVKEGNENESPESMVNESSEANAGDKGVGKFTTVELTNPLNQEWVKDGESVYNMKCLSCHKLTDEKLVGPGWKGVTTRRKPVWIMNFVTNTEEMIDKDKDAQKMLEECLTRMPNQNLSDHDARTMLEFMRNNDGVK